jgi:hypothetical protein
MEPEVLDVVTALALAVALAACAGLRAWLPLLLAGGLARAGLLVLGKDFAFLSSDKALLLFLVATFVEIVADKVPAVDHALDSVSTVLRPAAGALLAASAIGRVADPLTSLALGLAVGGAAASVPHLAKSGVRAASSALTMGIANPFLSVAEDVATVGLVALAVLVPVLMAASFVVIGFLVLRRVMRRRPQPATA